MQDCFTEKLAPHELNGGKLPFSEPLGFFVPFETFDTFIHLRVAMKATKVPGTLYANQIG